MDLVDKSAIMAELQTISNKNSKMYKLLDDKIKKIEKLPAMKVVPKYYMIEMIREILNCLKNDLEERAAVYKDIEDIMHKYVDEEGMR